MKFIIALYPYSWREGGTTAMHYFSKMLCDMGEEVYITTLNKDYTDNPFTDTTLAMPGNNSKTINARVASIIAQEDDVVTIYPEVEPGNPLNAKKVVRWVLYYPGGHSTGDTSFDSSEYVFAYSDRFVKGTIYESSPLLSIIQTRTNQFFDMNLERIYDCALIKKSVSMNFKQIKANHFDPYKHLLDKPLISLDQILGQLTRIEDLNLIFNKVRYFVSFDHATYHNFLASLSGCTSIVLPMDGVSKEQFVKDMPLYQYGVAYGFEDVKWANQTRGKMRAQLEKTEEQNTVFIKNFLNLVSEKWY